MVVVGPDPGCLTYRAPIIKLTKFKLLSTTPELDDNLSTPSMPPRLVLSRVCRSLTIRTRPSIAPPPPRIFQIASRRAFADEKQPAGGSNQNGLGGVSEEAADISRVMGQTQPELSQGTPVQDVRSELKSRCGMCGTRCRKKSHDLTNSTRFLNAMKKAEQNPRR